MNTMPELPAALPCDTIAASLAALALGADLELEEQELVLAHLAICPACRRRLDEYAAVAQILPLAAPEAEPPPELRARLLAKAEVSDEEATQRQELDSQLPLRTARFSWRWLRGLALALVLLALIGTSVAQGLRIYDLEASIDQQQAQREANNGLAIAAFGNDDAVEATLRAVGPALDASAKVFISPGEPAAALYARNLPTLPAGQTYQLWITHDGRTVSVSPFAVNAEGRVWRILRPPERLGRIERVFVTAEPADGSPQPTGPEYLSGITLAPEW